MRRRILLLSVGMTTLVVLAFAVPLTILMRNAVADEALKTAGLRAENIAYYVGDKDNTAADIQAYIDEVQGNRAGRISVRLADGSRGCVRSSASSHIWHHAPWSVNTEAGLERLRVTKSGWKGRPVGVPVFW